MWRRSPPTTGAAAAARSRSGGRPTRPRSPGAARTEGEGHDALRSIADEYLEARKGELRPVSYKITKLYLTGATYFGPLILPP